MGKLKLPEPDKRKRDVPMVHREALAPQDTIEYGLTVEVSLDKGRKAWIKFGTTSSVRDGETTEAARSRVTEYVNDEIDRRLDDLS